VDENGDEHFNWIMREITRKNHTITNPHYKIFDILNYDQFMGIEESLIFSSRYAILKEIFIDCEWYSVLEQERITCQEDFDRWAKKASDDEWEGFMLRKDVPYESGRTKDLLKVKNFCDDEYIVKDVVMGKATYNEGGSKEYDIVSALVIEHKGNRVEVGSGLSKEQRIMWYNNPQDIIGKTITVQYFEETKNKKNNLISLRFPVLKYVYEDGRYI
jgi:DNA ligase-1